MKDLRKRLLSRIQKKKSGCWEWTGPTYLPPRLSYGRIKVDGKTIAAHRASWIANRKAIPEGRLVLHKCDNPRCVRISHLFTGTHADNVRDCIKKGRRVSVLPPSDGENNGRAKLKANDVRWIRRNYKYGKAKAMAARFGVTIGAIHNAVRGFTWNHL